MIFLLALIINVIVAAKAICPETIDGLKRWSDAATWVGGIPPDGQIVHITEGILLDTTTNRLEGVFVHDGGRLVFDPNVELAKLVTKKLDIGGGGYVDIGSFDCNFTGQAEILLTGVRTVDDDDVDLEFGEKYIGVRENGSLEIHGKWKKSWTKLAETVTPSIPTFSNRNSQPGIKGVYMYEFDLTTGQPLREKYGKDYTKPNTKSGIDTYIKGLESSGTAVVIVNRGSKYNTYANPLLEQDNLLDYAVDVLEEKFGCNIGLRTSWTNVNDAWILLADMSNGKGGACYEQIDKIKDESDKEAKTSITQQIGDWVFVLKSRISTVNEGQKYRFDMDLFPPGEDSKTIKVIDDVTSWDIGDKIVIASTDYDFEQAEEVEVVNVIDPYTVQTKGVILYEHYGETYEGVDMRGEVGMLTRNVLIHGEMGDICTGEELNNCDNIHFDDYGGHTKAIRGFKAYNIIGAELTNMGQTARLGRYPIHFHMCHDVDTDGTNPLIESNSIHHCLSRCITVHGTHGVHIRDNVAHDTIGHCYFLEDGGEKRTVYDGNLGLTTRKGSLIPSDLLATTFWITSPLTTFVNNVAAGADKFGIWFLFPDEPVSHSYGLGFLQYDEARHTKITHWENNAAHSNGDKGFALFRRLREDHGILDCSTYDSWNDPMDKDKGKASVIFDGFTGYKNRKHNALLRGTTVEARNFRLAESIQGFEFERNMLDGYQLLIDSIIIGETPNNGERMRIRETLSTGKIVWSWSDKSVPIYSLPHETFIGVKIRARGPLHLRNVTFKGLEHKSLHQGCGISFHDRFNEGMDLSSSVKGLKFDFSDGEGDYVCHKNVDTGTEEHSMLLRDLDGSLTGTAGSTVVSPDPSLHDGMDCETNDAWKMSICHGRFGKFHLWPHYGVGETYITRLDDLDNIVEDNKNTYVSYVVNSEHTFVLQWTSAILELQWVRVTGLEDHQTLTIGVCLPMSVVDLINAGTATLGDFFVTYEKNNHETELVEATSLEDLRSDQTKTIFLDKQKGILFVKSTEALPMEDDDYGVCPGGIRFMECPLLKLDFRRFKDDIDFSDGKCGGR